MIYMQAAMVGHVFFNGYKIFYRHVFTAINILWEFREDIFIDECDWSLILKCDNTHMHTRTHACMHARKAFHDLQTLALARGW